VIDRVGAKAAQSADTALTRPDGCNVREHTVKKVRGSEEGINAELRALTQQTRRLREELQEMIRPPTRDRVRGFVHQRRWPKPPPSPPHSERHRRDPNKS